VAFYTYMPGKTKKFPH